MIPSKTTLTKNSVASIITGVLWVRLVRLFAASIKSSGFSHFAEKRAAALPTAEKSCEFDPASNIPLPSSKFA